MLEEEIGKLSNERLEATISGYYWGQFLRVRGAVKAGPFRFGDVKVLPERGLLADLWAEFDRREAEGLI